MQGLWGGRSPANTMPQLCWPGAGCTALVLWGHGDSPTPAHPLCPLLARAVEQPGRVGFTPRSRGCWGGGSCLCPGETQHSSVTRTATSPCSPLWHWRSIPRRVPAAREGSHCPASQSLSSGCLAGANVVGREADAIPAACCSAGCKQLTGLARGPLNS